MRRPYHIILQLFLLFSLQFSAAIAAPLQGAATPEDPLTTALESLAEAVSFPGIAAQINREILRRIVDFDGGRDLALHDFSALSPAQEESFDAVMAALVNHASPQLLTEPAAYGRAGNALRLFWVMTLKTGKQPKIQSAFAKIVEAMAFADLTGRIARMTEHYHDFLPPGMLLDETALLQFMNYLEGTQISSVHKGYAFVFLLTAIVPNFAADSPVTNTFYLHFKRAVMGVDNDAILTSLAIDAANAFLSKMSNPLSQLAFLENRNLLQDLILAASSGLPSAAAAASDILATYAIPSSRTDLLSAMLNGLTLRLLTFRTELSTTERMYFSSAIINIIADDAVAAKDVSALLGNLSEALQLFQPRIEANETFLKQLALELTKYILASEGAAALAAAPIDECPEDDAKTKAGFCGCGVPDDDSDGDNAMDCVDFCPSDPRKLDPGICNCGTPDDDFDGDGTADCNDLCPTDPTKTEPGVCDCGVSDADSDGDNTTDCLDECPSDSSKSAGGICNCGMPDDDSDEDGTLDCEEPCPQDSTKLTEGECGCGIPDVDLDGDGSIDCDFCPADPSKLAGGSCGCGIPDIDSDANGQIDCLEPRWILEPLKYFLVSDSEGDSKVVEDGAEAVNPANADLGFINELFETPEQFVDALELSDAAEELTSFVAVESGEEPPAWKITETDLRAAADELYRHTLDEPIFFARQALMRARGDLTDEQIFTAQLYRDIRGFKLDLTPGETQTDPKRELLKKLKSYPVPRIVFQDGSLDVDGDMTTAFEKLDLGGKTNVLSSTKVPLLKTLTEYEKERNKAGLKDLATATAARNAFKDLVAEPRYTTLANAVLASEAALRAYQQKFEQISALTKLHDKLITTPGRTLSEQKTYEYFFESIPLNELSTYDALVAANEIRKSTSAATKALYDNLMNTRFGGKLPGELNQRFYEIREDILAAFEPSDALSTLMSKFETAAGEKLQAFTVFSKIQAETFPKNFPFFSAIESVEDYQQKFRRALGDDGVVFPMKMLPLLRKLEMKENWKKQLIVSFDKENVPRVILIEIDKGRTPSLTRVYNLTQEQHALAGEPLQQLIQEVSYNQKPGSTLLCQNPLTGEVERTEGPFQVRLLGSVGARVD